MSKFPKFSIKKYCKIERDTLYKNIQVSNFNLHNIEIFKKKLCSAILQDTYFWAAIRSDLVLVSSSLMDCLAWISDCKLLCRFNSSILSSFWLRRFLQSWSWFLFTKIFISNITEQYESIRLLLFYLLDKVSDIINFNYTIQLIIEFKWKLF